MYKDGGKVPGMQWIDPPGRGSDRLRGIQPAVEIQGTGGGFGRPNLGRGYPSPPRSNRHRLINPPYPIRGGADRIDPVRTGFAPLKIFQKVVVEQAISTKRPQNMTV